MKKHLDFSFSTIECLALLILLISIPGILYLPEKYGYENGLLENLQMIVLFMSVFFAFKAREHRKFFNLLILVLGILLLREINCGRTIFFPIPGEVNAFYSWKDIQYGWLAHPLYGIYIGLTVIYGIWHKFYKDFLMFLTHTKLPIWNILFFILGITLSLIAEKSTHNFLFEEFSELLMYVSILGIIKKYAFKEYEAVE